MLPPVAGLMHHTSLQRRKARHGMVVAWSCIIFRVIVPIIFKKCNNSNYMLTPPWLPNPTTRL